MILEYGNRRLRYASSEIEIADSMGNTIDRIRTQDLPEATRRLLRRRRYLPATLLAIFHDLVSGGREPSTLFSSKDKTYPGCRDAIYLMALWWNRKLRPTFVPRPRPIRLLEAFGGQGALTTFRNIEVILFYEKGSGIGRMRLRKKKEDGSAFEVTLPLSVNAAIRWIAVFLYSANQWSCGGCSPESVGRVQSSPGEGAADASSSSTRGSSEVSSFEGRRDPGGGYPERERKSIAVCA